MNAIIEACRANPKTIITKNIRLSKEEVEALAAKLNASGKKGRIDGTFVKVEDLLEEHVQHFKNSPYMFRPMPGKMFGGMLLDESMNYVRIVLLSEDVLDYILNL